MQKQKNVTTGIYKITSPSGKVYIGQSINIEKRKEEYKSTGLKRQYRIYGSVQKYGWNNHQFEIIEECSIKQLDEHETFWKTYYLEQVDNDWTKVLFCNLHDSGGGPKSEETKRKISASLMGRKSAMKGKHHTPEARLKMKNHLEHHKKLSEFHMGRTSPMKGKYHTEKTKEKIRISKKNNPYIRTEESKLLQSISRKGFKYSDEVIEKIRIGKYKPIIQLDLDDVFIKEWECVDFICIELNYKCKTNILQVCQNKRKTAYGFKWKFK